MKEQGCDVFLLGVKLFMHHIPVFTSLKCTPNSLYFKDYLGIL